MKRRERLKIKQVESDDPLLFSLIFLLLSFLGFELWL